jgi:hypothetical protein
MTTNTLSKFDLFVKQHELKPQTAEHLKTVLSTCKIVLLCDDSSSMGSLIAEEGSDPFAQKKSTRWLELKKLAAVLIEFVTMITDDGLDIYFLNRKRKLGVTDMSGLQMVFSDAPSGATPLISKIRYIHDKYIDKLDGKQLLIIVITDGEPSDGSRNDLFNTLNYVTRGGNVHVSFAECTDNEEDMEYLDSWDGKIKNFDNTDDYREELRRVKMAKGQSFKFDYTDYVVKILLATFIRWYFNLDQSNGNNQNYPNNQNNSCQCILI